MRILILSDVHGNADALKAVLDSARGWDSIWVLGDLVDYGPEPHVVIDIVRGLAPDVIVMGNHDNAVAYDTDCRCAAEIHDLSEYTRKNVSYKLLSKDHIEWLKSLPQKVDIEIFGKRFYIVHGSPRNPLYGYLKPDLPRDHMLLQLTPSMLAVKPRPVEASAIVVGHTHIPMDIDIDGSRILNPGSCGQPRDGDPRASYALYDPETDTFTIHRVEYDIDKTVEKLKQLNLEQQYLERLISILRTGRV